MRRLVGITATLILLLSVAWSSAQAVSDACPDIDAWPSFSELAPRAHRVVIGTVSEVEGPVATRITVEEVLRGSSSRRLELSAMRARFGQIPEGCPFDGTVAAEIGDRLAVALRTRPPGGTHRQDTAALLDAADDHPNASGLDRLTTTQVRLLLGHEPSGSTVAEPGRNGPPPDLFERLLRALPGGIFDFFSVDEGE